MSFFEVLKRMAQGKPAFEAKQDTPEQPDGPGALEQTGPVIRKGDESSFPVVYAKRTKTTINGDKMEVRCVITNTWPEEVLLDKITVGSTKRELDAYLDGNGEREFLVYSGPRFSGEVHEAQLDYKTRQEGDYFRAVHDVACAYHQDDKVFTVNELRLNPPIIDIYG